MAHQSMPRQDPIAYLLIGIMLINLPGAVTALTQSPGVAAESHFGSVIAYPIALLSSLYLLARYFRLSSVTITYALFATFFTVYLGSSVAFSLMNRDLNDSDLTVLVMYIFQFLFISSLYFWVAQLKNDEMECCFRFSKYILLIAALSVIFSPLLPYYQGKAVDRAGGFLIDQNQAAFAALYCLVLVAAYPARHSLIALTESVIAIAALMLTFSRTGLLVLILLCLLYLVTRRSPREAALAIAGFAILIFTLSATIGSDLIHLNFEQRQRLEDVAAILTGDTVQKTYDQRDILFDLGLHRISEQLPWGAGIGKFHEMEYGVRHRPTGHWLGVHNTYLLILGESGLLGFMAFLAFWIAVLWRIAQPSDHRAVSVGITIVILSSMMTTHAVFNYKVSAVMIAFVIALTARVPARHHNYILQHGSPKPSAS